MLSGVLPDSFLFIETYKQNFTRFLIFDDSIHVDKSRINKVTDMNILGEYEAAV